MVAALELYFDPTADRRVRALWDALEAAGVPSLREHTHRKHRPHVSLAVADELDADKVRDALNGMRIAPAIALSLQYVGQFVGRVLWLGPAPTVDLLAHHRVVWERLQNAGLAISELYAPDSWVPHCTLSMRVPRPLISDAVRTCLEVIPVDVRLTGAAVVDHARGRLDRLE
jgi:2'-5' RNA ligase